MQASYLRPRSKKKQKKTKIKDESDMLDLQFEKLL